jgi:hypothetical protein
MRVSAGAAIQSPGRFIGPILSWIGRREFDMNHAAVLKLGNGRSSGSVQEQRSHHEDIAGLGLANHWLLAGPVGDLCFRKAAVRVAAGQNHERTVVGGSRIEMQAQGHQLSEKFWRGLNMQQVVFYGPTGEAGGIKAFSDDDSEVLVPVEIPVGLGSLIEKNRLVGLSLGEKTLGQGSQKLGGECLQERRVNEEAADSVRSFVGFEQGLQLGCELGAAFGRNGAAKPSEPIAVE